MSDPSNAHSGIGALLTPQNSELHLQLKVSETLCATNFLLLARDAMAVTALQTRERAVISGPGCGRRG